MPHPGLLHLWISCCNQDPKDAVDHAPVVDTRHAARLVRQERPDRRPLVVGELVADDSRPRFGSLNHTPGDTHHSATARRGRRPYPGFTSAFGGTADMARAAAGFVPVANDPSRTSVARRF